VELILASRKSLKLRKMTLLQKWLDTTCLWGGGLRTLWISLWAGSRLDVTCTFPSILQLEGRWFECVGPHLLTPSLQGQTTSIASIRESGRGLCNLVGQWVSIEFRLLKGARLGSQGLMRRWSYLTVVDGQGRSVRTPTVSEYEIWLEHLLLMQIWSDLCAMGYCLSPWSLATINGLD